MIYYKYWDPFHQLHLNRQNLFETHLNLCYFIYSFKLNYNLNENYRLIHFKMG